MARLERRHAPEAHLVVEIEGGLPTDDGCPVHASAGALTFQRAAAEPYAAFRQRVLAAAPRASLVVIGGLP